MSSIAVTIEAHVNPTESYEKVESAVKNIFPESTLKSDVEGELIKAHSEGLRALVKMKNLLRRERIRDAARRVLKRGKNRGTITFYLNKQAASVNRLSFSEPIGESPLGPIKVTISCDDPEEIIQWLTSLRD